MTPTERTEPGYTEEDVRRVAEALRSRGGVTWSAAIQDAHNVLDALSAAGRLLPADARVEWAWRCARGCVHEGEETWVRRIAPKVYAQMGGGPVTRRARTGPWDPVPEDAPHVPEALPVFPPCADLAAARARQIGHSDAPAVEVREDRDER